MTAKAAAERRWIWAFLAVCVTLVLVLGSVAFLHGVDADEGFYLAAAWRVRSGARLYTDFFFPQMPYLPYAQAAVLALTGPSLFGARMVSAVCGALLGGILVVAAGRRTGGAGAGFMMFAYAGHALVLSYVPVAKTYGLANLALVSSFLLVAPAETKVARAAAAGACAGIAIGTRLPMAAAVACLLVWLAIRDVRQLLAFGAGLLGASLPWIWIATRNPENFWFSNFAFHELRREISGIGPVMTQKAGVLLKWLLVPENLFVWVLAGYGLRRAPRSALPAVVCAGSLGIAYMAATPTYLQYMVQLLPFLLLASIPALPVLVKRPIVIAAGAGLYLLGLTMAFRPPPEGTRRHARIDFWRLDAVERVATYLHEHTAADDRILSWWEGYPVLAQRRGFIGVGFWESNAAKKLPAAARRRFHLMGQKEIRRLIVDREPRLVVFPDGVWKRQRAALGDRYRLSARFGTLQVFERRDAPVPAS